jgi:predicted Zn-dependent peptidase
VLENDVALGLDVIADILRNPVLDPKEIEVERGVILQEIGQALDTPDDVIFDWLQEEAYPNQPLGRTILGPAERVSAFGQTDLRSFIDDHYGPEQMILAAAGAVDHDEIVKLAETLFGDMPAKPLFQTAPAQFKGGETRQLKPLEQAHFALGFESPGYRADDIYVAQIYASALGGGMSSRLFQEIRENRGLCYSIFAQAGAYADTGMMTVYAGTSADQLPELAGITIDEMKRAAADMSPAEVARARAQMKAGLLMGLESPSNRAERLARLIQIWDRIPPLEETIEKIDAVQGGFDVSQGALQTLQEIYHSGRASEEETSTTIADTLKTSAELLCPHSAIGVKVANEQRDPAIPMITLATAHPAKFPDAVEAATGVRPGLPPRMSDLFDRDERLTRVENDLDALKTLIKGKLNA